MVNSTARQIPVFNTTFLREDYQSCDAIILSCLAYLPDDSEKTLVYFHGNAGCAMNRAELVAPLAGKGINIIVADYRGYGANPGTPSEDGLVEDAVAVISFAKSLGKPVILP